MLQRQCVVSVTIETLDCVHSLFYTIIRYLIASQYAQ